MRRRGGIVALLALSGTSVTGLLWWACGWHTGAVAYLATIVTTACLLFRGIRAANRDSKQDHGNNRP